MYTKPWSEEEDDSIREFYAEHGQGWAGWAEVLPDRTRRAIGARARRIGVKRPVAKHSATPPRRKSDGDDWHYKIELVREKDQRDEQVMDFMRAGMTPSEIDRRMHWWPSTTVGILVDLWSREEQ